MSFMFKSDGEKRTGGADLTISRVAWDVSRGACTIITLWRYTRSSIHFTLHKRFMGVGSGLLGSGKVLQRMPFGGVVSDMGKYLKENDAHALASRLQRNSSGKRRDLRWKMIYIVTVTGFIGLLQLIVVEERWYWASSEFHQSAPTAQKEMEKTSRVMQRTMVKSAGQYRSPPEVEKPKNVKLLEFKDENRFLPLKDVKESGMSSKDTNWFMSGLRGNDSQGNGETFDLPNDDPKGRVLCVRGNDMRDGTKNGYGLFDRSALPRDAIFLEHTTFIADNYWDYNNPWHSMSALANFVTWRLENRCSTPERLLLYHMGELVTSMGSWITHVLQAAFMKVIPIETLNSVGGADSSVCFQRAVVQRRGLGGVDKAHINGVFDMLRCRARRYCGVKRIARSSPSVEVLLLTRSGPRAFTNETAVANVVREACSKAPGCSLRVVNAGNLTFCEQVEQMTSTDVLITVHGAQLTNMMFMSPGARVMEMFPKGWLEFAGVGQEIYKWHADWTRVVHVGRWRDPEGPDCPYPITETLNCLLFFKDREVGLNATHLANWTGTVLRSFGATAHLQQYGQHNDCACDEDDRSFGAFTT